MNRYKVIFVRSRSIEVEAEDEEEAEDKGLSLIDFSSEDFEIDGTEVELLEQNCYTDQQELQDEEKRYEDKYGY